MTNPQSTLVELFEALNMLDVERQKMFEAIMMSLMEKIRCQQRLKGEMVCLGADAIIRLMSDQNCDESWYNHEILGRCYRSAARLSPTSQTLLINTLIEPVRLVHIYCDVCQKTAFDIQLDDIRAILEASFSEGTLGGRQQLEFLVGSDLLKACLAV
ncbi:MAG: hypothetical protein VKK59_04325 [Vampirovibrionales bacterium]|nr:hypothetical protein [Vampirovibrionales bacterium]